MAGNAAAAITKLIAALRAYAPKRMAKLRGAKSLSSIERIADVHRDLRALWGAADGAAEIIVPSASRLGAAMDLMSVTEAARELRALRKLPGFPRGFVPFATDGAGNFAGVDARGRVLDWDHETRKLRALAPSLEALLARTKKAMDKEVLFGGAEGRPVSAATKRIVGKVEAWLSRKGGVDIFSLFGNDIFRIVRREGPGSLELLDAVEDALKRGPKDMRRFIKPYLEKVAAYRKRATEK